MKRDFLKDLGIADDVIDKIMAENGRDIESAKNKFADYEDIKKQLETAKATMDKWKDYDQVKADVDNWKAECEKAVKEGEQKVKRLERQSQVKDFLSGIKDEKGNPRKFVNEITRNAIADKLLAEMEKEESKGKGLDDLFKAVAKDTKDIFTSDDSAPKPPTVTPMSGGGNPASSWAQGNTQKQQSWNRFR